MTSTNCIEGVQIAKMGVKNLRGLIECNPSLQQRHFLHGGTVVIDGWNLAFRLYLEASFDCILGGEYSRYFRLYKDANVHCVVMLDGAYDPSNSKLRTIQKRNMDRISQMKRLKGADAEKIKVMPPLATDVYRTVLADLDVEMIQCVFEADEHIARRANQLNCPVISDDSDFFVYDLKGGLIPLSSLNRETTMKQLNPNGPTVKGIDCKIYKVENLLNKFNPEFNRELLPLFGTIVGNDFVAEDTFSHFFQTIRAPRDCRLHYNPPHATMVAMLSFLSRQKSLEECIDIVLRCTPKERRDKLHNLMKDGIARYRSEFSDERVTYKNGVPMPDWVVQKFRAGEVPSEVITMATTGIHFLFVKVEVVSMISSYQVSLLLRKSLYRLVFKGHASMVQELDRSGHDMQFQDIEFTTGEVGLSEIPDLSADQRRTILINCIQPKVHCADLVKLPAGKLLMYALEYLVLNTMIEWEFALSLLVMHVAVQATAARTMTERVNYLLGIYVNSKQVQGFSSFYKKPTSGQRLDLDLIYKTNQYTGCLDTIHALNQVLGAHKINFKFHLVMNGVFLHNFYKDLKGRPQPHRYLANHLQPNSRLHLKFEELWSQVFQRLFSESRDQR
ncbi:protein asteroid homolog 1-like isoform X2 [Varroa jacobsoni]|nr:protein asteroid homolog 1-like isoform X2 [Varroa jacobsoni]